MLTDHATRCRNDRVWLADSSPTAAVCQRSEGAASTLEGARNHRHKSQGGFHGAREHAGSQDDAIRRFSVAPNPAVAPRRCFH